MMKDLALEEYSRKRDFQKTTEPKANIGKSHGNRFVIQKHAATRLHYDFRLEMNGVLKSWAVPRGIPTVRGEKHLAVQVEDHPRSYVDFEGTIPKGQYGGGTVMVWDHGTFSTDTKSPSKELDSGKLHFTLAGKKLRGDWHLTRMRDKKNWLLIKSGESLKPISVKADDTSALSGKTMKQLGESGSTWESKPRNEEKKSFAAKIRKIAKRKTSILKFVEPMKAKLAASPPSHGDWIYEIKFDGFRALALKSGDRVQLLSRNNKDFNDKFPEIAEAVATLEADEVILDGEIVALDKKGVSSFQLLQAFELGQERPPIFFYVFDLLQLNAEDLKNQPLVERKARLETILNHGPTRSRGANLIRFSSSLGANARPLLKQAEKLGLEGLIGKRKDSIYEPGRRSGAWIKLKLHREQEFIIGGYSDPEGSRSHFGALLVGFYEKRKLKFCGKVGTGFNTKLLSSLHAQFKKIARDECPFINLPESRAGRYGAGVTKAEMKRCHWIEPALVCQIKFSEWTRDAKLRQPVFLGLREDKDAAEVVREKVEA
ncbi:MAG TPA: non-homologous end-joining DNA ligase [Verrucomicrobiae bacterium]|nr:non-homologous end-joining DNA ligase [Verrucomicrobiae bacterium]